MFRVCKIVGVLTTFAAKVRGSSAAVLLLLAVLLGLGFAAIAQSAWWWGQAVSIRQWLLDYPVQYLVIAPFFFLVGLELRREVIGGSLRPLRNAISPLLAAILGVTLPAIWFLAITAKTPFAHGWPIPTATDVTFALAVFVAFGGALPRSTRTFLLTFAVIDDLIAVVLITLVFGFSANTGFAELVPVVLAFLIPLRWPTRIEGWLLRYLNWVGLPIFGLVMSAVALSSRDFRSGALVFWAVVARPLWKFIGIYLGGSLGTVFTTPEARLNPSHMAAVASLGGIGFTVSLLVAGIAYEGMPEAYGTALEATFVASGISALVGAVLLVRGHRSKSADRA